jgi:hypothetical protein
MMVTNAKRQGDHAGQTCSENKLVSDSPVNIGLNSQKHIAFRKRRPCNTDSLFTNRSEDVRSQKYDIASLVVVFGETFDYSQPPD